MIRKNLEVWPLFVMAALGSALAVLAGLPMPYLLGSLAGSAVCVALIERVPGRIAPKPNKWFRFSFVAIIGVMIGASFNPDLLSVLPAFWLSVLAVVVFIVVAHFGGYQIMRRLGGFRPIDAFYAAMPGGLVESTILGEKAGADVTVLAIQHFIRIILVVTVVPLLFLVFTGELVGSAAGATFSIAAYHVDDVALIVVLAPIGMALGRLSRIPASHLMGPLFFSAGLHVSGLIDIAAPPWLLYLAQLVIGVGLGAQFSGISRRMLMRGLGTGAMAVSYMLVLSFGFAVGLSRLVPAEVEALFLAFAPGGVTEMNLIALSLHLSPVIVAVHHLVRIMATVVISSAVGRRLWAGLE